MTRLSANSHNAYSLLYAAKNPEAKEAAKESPFIFGSLDVTGLPSQSVQRLVPSEHNHWLPRQEDSSSRVERHVIVSTGSGTGLAKVVWDQLMI